MSGDRIDLAAIRERADDPFAPVPADDLAALCDEVERLRAENAAIRADVIRYADGVASAERGIAAQDEEIAALRAENARLTRACVEGLPREVIVCPACSEKHIEGARHDDPSIDGRVRPHHTHRCYSCGHVWDAGRWSYGDVVPCVAVPMTAHESTVDMLTAEIRTMCGERDALRAANRRITTELDDARNVALGAVADCAGLREIIAGRTTAPTDAEIEAHAKAGGSWLGYSEIGPYGFDRSEVASHRDRVIRWWALDASGAPCAWPVVTEVTP